MLQPGLLTGAATELKQDDVITELVLLNSNTPTDFYQEVTLGNIPGQARGQTGANNPGLSADNLESVNNIRLETGTGMLYPFLTADTTLFASSSSASDTGTYVVVGLDDTLTEVTRFVTLTGQTPVALSGDIFRISIMLSITGTNSVGSIYLSSDSGDITDGVPVTLSKVLAKIDVGGQQSIISSRTVPAGKKMYIFAIESQTSKAADVDINIRFRFTLTDEFSNSPPFQVFQSGVNVIEKMGFVIPEDAEFDIAASSPTAGSKVTVGILLVFIDV